MEIVPVIMSGGVGSRLWPLSRREHPKQLQRLVGDQTMIQATAGRVEGIDGAGPPLIVCNQAQGEGIAAGLAEVGVAAHRMVLEPEGRNTAPAVAVAALLVGEGDPVLLVLPADHLIGDVAAFRAAVGVAAGAASSGAMVTFGVVPTRPETGYGYLRCGDPVGEGAFRVDRFVEKPDNPEALVASEEHMWNSGMFAFRTSAYLEELGRHQPGMVEACREAIGTARVEGPFLVLGEAFLRAESISIDYAVMERTDRAVVVPLDAGWSDVGSWESLWEVEERDSERNVIIGDVLAEDVAGSYLRSEGRLLAVVGLQDVLVVETADAVLVCPRERAQDVKRVVDRLTGEGRPEVERHPHR
ncbi:MAG: mannose-1-phosphate guanylyltransferase/mannose-6-phosphate isomerase [Acidimicrobiia bacterium]